jgi:ATP-dependent HslUV protease subunit HslV
MTTIVVAKKAGQVAMAADTLVTFGDTKLPHRFEDNSKIFSINANGIETLVGMAGTVAHFPVLRKALASIPKDELKLGSKLEIFETFTLLHAKLKEDFFLQTKEEDADPYESSQFSLLLANASGIYGVYSYREVFEFKEFWALGSGRNFALGALYGRYASAKSAKELAELGVQAGCEFDKSSSGPIDVFTLKLKAKA